MAINFLFDHTDVVRLLVKLRLAPRGQGAAEGGRAAPHEAAAGAIDAGSHPSPEMNCYTYIDNDYDVCEDDMSDNRYHERHVGRRAVAAPTTQPHPGCRRAGRTSLD